MSFHVGQLVVCVDDSPLTAPPPPRPWIQWDRDMDGLLRGRVYTIRDSGIRSVCDVDGVRLNEIVRRPCPVTGTDPAYSARRFRPVDDTRIAVFRQALTSVPQGEEVA